MRSYLKFLSRNALYSAIQAAGLVVGLALVVVIANSIRDQVRSVTSLQDHGRVYMAGAAADPHIEYRLAERLRETPGVELVACLKILRQSMSGSDAKVLGGVLVADSGLSEVVPLEVLAGSMDQVWSGGGAALTRSAASRLFPETDPLGLPLGFSSENTFPEPSAPRDLPVVAIVEDPTYTMLNDFEAVVSFRAQLPAVEMVRDSDISARGWGSPVPALVKLRDGADPAEVGSRMKADVEFGRYISHVAKYEPDMPVLTPVGRSIASPLAGTVFKTGGMQILWVLVAMGLLLLFTTGLNYVNLGTAITAFRVKEMATRRLLGEDRSGIAGRLVSESLLFTAACYVLAVPAASALIPFLESIRPVHPPFPFRVEAGFTAVLGVVLVAVLGTASGAVSSGLVASYRPIDVVSGKVRRARKMVFNKVCIALQAAIALTFTAMCLVVAAQFDHLRNLDTGTDPARDVFAFVPDMFHPVTEIEDALSRSPHIEAVGHSYGIPCHARLFSSTSDNDNLSVIECDTTAFRLLGFRIKERFTDIRPGTLWIPEELARKHGITSGNPDLGKVGSPWETRIDAVGGVIEPFRITPSGWGGGYGIDNAYPAVQIVPAEQVAGLVVQTTPDHEGAVRDLREAVASYYAPRIGVPEFGDGRGMFGYLPDIAAADYENLRRLAMVIGVFGAVAILLAMLGLLAMSTYFAASESTTTAIRKVLGATPGQEVLRSVRLYMSLVAAGCAVAVPVCILLAGRLLETFPEKIGHQGWIVAATTVFVLAVGFVSVLWPVFRLARTNPADALKKE